MRSKPHKYTQEQKDFIFKNVKGLLNSELAELFNKEFGTDISEKKMLAIKKFHGLRSGLDTRFQKGQISHNKGKKGGRTGEATQFKKGSVPHNWKAVGAERVGVDGYVLIKTAEPNVWNAKHRILWEAEYGKIPEGKSLLFLDGNKQNLELSNLQLVDQSVILMAVRNDLLFKDPDLTKVGLTLATLKDKTNKKAKERKK